MFKIFASNKKPLTDSPVLDSPKNFVLRINQCKDGLMSGIGGNNRIANKKMHEDAIASFQKTINEATISGTREEKGHALITLVTVSKSLYLPDATKRELTGFLKALNTSKAFTDLTLRPSDCKVLIQQMNFQPEIHDAIGWDKLDLDGLQVQVGTEFLLHTLQDASKYDWEIGADNVKNALDLVSLLSSHHIFEDLQLSKEKLSGVKPNVLELAGLKSDMKRLAVRTNDRSEEVDDCAACIIS